MAKEKDCTPAQLAIAWLLARNDNIIPIPGTKRRDRLEENIGAFNVKLSRDDMVKIDEIMPLGAAVGERYPATGMALIYR
jgi:aryl-alcohol dehydrogenase-like predicted oxidoreductase